MVRVVRGDHVDWRNRTRTPDVLRVDDPSLVNARMQAPDLTFGFAAPSHRILGEVSRSG